MPRKHLTGAYIASGAPLRTAKHYQNLIKLEANRLKIVMDNMT